MRVEPHNLGSVRLPVGSLLLGVSCSRGLAIGGYIANLLACLCTLFTLHDVRFRLRVYLDSQLL